jgi:hypothetical protein
VNINFSSKYYNILNINGLFYISCKYYFHALPKLKYRAMRRKGYNCFTLLGAGRPFYGKRVFYQPGHSPNNREVRMVTAQSDVKMIRKALDSLKKLGISPRASGYPWSYKSKPTPVYAPGPRAALRWRRFQTPNKIYPCGSRTFPDQESLGHPLPQLPALSENHLTLNCSPPGLPSGAPRNAP